MKRLIPIIIIIVIILTTVASANGMTEPKVETNLTEMLQSFINGRLRFHNKDYYVVYLHQIFPKGDAFLAEVHNMIDGKAVIPDHYYFDVVITGPVNWYDDNGIDAIFPLDGSQVYYYRYYPNTGEYTLYQVRNSYHTSNFGWELMFTNISGGPWGAYPLGQYTLRNPQGKNNYWGTGVQIYHDIKLYDKGQIDYLLAEKYHEGYVKGKEDGKNLIIDESEAYQRGYSKGHSKGYDEGYRNGRLETDETTRNILAFGGSVLGSIFSFILYVSTEVEIFGISLLDVMVALAVIAIIFFIIRLIRG